MADNLVIVESPAKAKTISGFLGKNFVVKSSYGHVRDLAKAGMGIDVENNFEPTYEISADKKDVLKELEKHAKKAKMVWLATDEDREGEAISWHLVEALKLKKKNTKRIVFHEITKDAIKEAVENPRDIDKNLVDAQQARRILDRLVGFELSPILWKKIKPSLSAGRVQSVAVRLIVEREREIEVFNSISTFKVTGQFLVPDEKGNTVVLKAELNKKFGKYDDAEKFLQKSVGAVYTITSLEKKPGKKSPSAPFTTSTLQQEASRKLGFSVAQTMRVAQNLYEAGKITYMRTDSVNLSQLALDAAKKEITKLYGNNYVHTRQYKTKTASAQEAHEAIRPSYLNHQNIDGDNNEQRLYDLIWKRTIASQMSDAELERTIVTISSSKAEEQFIATGEVILFDGFLKVYLEGRDDETEEVESGLLPPMKENQQLDVDEITATERFSSPPSRYNEASLVRKLEELGIGRPSTYAPTISTVQKRGYVVKEDRQGKERTFRVLHLKEDKLKAETKTETYGNEKKKLFPTDMGAVVNDFLMQYFDDILDFNFTATVEKEFDEIAEGNMKWADMIRDFYKPFHKDVVKTEKTSERASGERILGKDPVSGKEVSVRIGRYGPLAQKKMDENDEKPEFARLRHGQRLETITFEEALELFKLPRTVGEYEGKEVIAAIGRFGPYLKHDNVFYSLPKEDDPHDVEMERSVEIIEAKRKQLREKVIKTFPENPEVQVLNGRYGPYIVVGKKNVRIPKDKDPQKLTLEECLQLEKDAAEKKGKFRKFSRKKS